MSTKIIEVTGTQPLVTVDENVSNVEVVNQPIEITVSSAVAVGNATIRNALGAIDPIYYDKPNGVFGFIDRSEVVRSEKMADPANLPEYAGELTGDIILDAENFDIFVINISGDIDSIQFNNIADGQTVTIIGTQSTSNPPGIINQSSGNWTNWYWINDNADLPQNAGDVFMIKVLWTGNTYYASLMEFNTLMPETQVGIPVSDTPPDNPDEGWLWYRYQSTDPDALMIYVDSDWVVAGGGGGASVHVGETEPPNPTEGDLWYDTGTAINPLKIYYDNSWVTANPGQEGPRGFTGSRGPIGFVGSRGFTGSAGFTGSKGEQGETGFNGSASTIPGPQGDTGFTGSQGFTGSTGAFAAVGFTGSRGETGYTGSASTALGPQGYTGSQGSTGPLGQTGYSGSRGWTGSTGFTGSQGEASTTPGPVGSTGFTGSIGFTGSQGEASTTPGPVGSTGFTGSIGFTGSQGDQGDIGYTGSAGQGIMDEDAPPDGLQYARVRQPGEAEGDGTWEPIEATGGGEWDGILYDKPAVIQQPNNITDFDNSQSGITIGKNGFDDLNQPIPVQIGQHNNIVIGRGSRIYSGLENVICLGSQNELSDGTQGGTQIRDNSVVLGNLDSQNIYLGGIATILDESLNKWGNDLNVMVVSPILPDRNLAITAEGSVVIANKFDPADPDQLLQINATRVRHRGSLDPETGDQAYPYVMRTEIYPEFTNILSARPHVFNPATEDDEINSVFSTWSEMRSINYFSPERIRFRYYAECVNQEKPGAPPQGITQTIYADATMNIDLHRGTIQHFILTEDVVNINITSKTLVDGSPLRDMGFSEFMAEPGTSMTLILYHQDSLRTIDWPRDIGNQAGQFMFLGGDELLSTEVGNLPDPIGINGEFISNIMAIDMLHAFYDGITWWGSITRGYA